MFRPNQPGKYHICKESIAELRWDPLAQGWLWVRRKPNLDSVSCEVAEKILDFMFPDGVVTIEPKKHNNNLGDGSGFLYMVDKVFEHNFKRKHQVLIATFLKRYSFKLVCKVEHSTMTMDDLYEICRWFGAGSPTHNGSRSWANTGRIRGEVMYIARGHARPGLQAQPAHLVESCPHPCYVAYTGDYAFSRGISNLHPS